MAQAEPRERRTLQTTDEVMADMFGYWQEIKRRKAEGTPVVLAPVTMPYEIFRAMDVPVEPLDNIGSMVPALRLAPKYCEIAEQRGLPRDTCSLARCFVGLLHAGDDIDPVLNDLYTPPDVIVGASYLCPVQNNGFLHAAKHLNAPYFLFDGPVNCWGKNLPGHAVDYYVRQFEDLIRFLERFGFKMDWEKLRSEIEATKRILALQEEIETYMRAVPAPMGGVDVCFSPLVSAHLRGRQALPLQEKKRDELRERVESGIGVIDGETLRLLWYVSPPLYNFELLHYPEKFGAVVVTSWIERTFIGYDPSVLDPDRPLESLAKRLLTRVDGPTFQFLPGELIRIVKDLKIDGVVAAMMRSCSVMPAQMRRLRDDLLEATGVPTLLVDVDYLDSRECDETQITGSLDSFVATLLEGKGA